MAVGKLLEERAALRDDVQVPFLDAREEQIVHDPLGGGDVRNQEVDTSHDEPPRLDLYTLSLWLRAPWRLR
jgi:hypothetical protein